MNRFFKLKLGSASQSELMDLLKSNGCEVIQLSDGLCAKTQLDRETLTKLTSKTGDGIVIEDLDPQNIGADASAPADLKAFVGVNS